jgi:predicted acyl esterase
MPSALAAALLISCRIGVESEDGERELADGTKLAWTLVHPQTPGPWPVLLVRTSYGRASSAAAAHDFVDRGMAVYVEDVRGTGHSGGSWTPFVHERADGEETFDWVAKQPWCNGRVGGWGMSYLGITQWELAPHAGSRLAAMTCHFTSADVYRDVVHFGGVQGLAIALSWSESTSGSRGMPKFRTLPLIDADDASGKGLPCWDDWCRHYRLDDYWSTLDFANRYADVKAPAFLVAGWYDLFLPGQIDDYVQLSKRKGPPEQSFARLIVGPWDHGGFERATGRPDLGPEAYVAPLPEERDFLDRFLVGAANGYEAKAGVRAFFLGENAWRELAAWPPPQAQSIDCFLHSLGGASRKPGDGTLLIGRAPSRAEDADAFAYDPRDPCPSYAGNLWTPLATLSDQAKIAERPDVLVYQTPPLAQDLRIAGPVTLELWIESDAPDTDFAAKLVDVAPDGTADWRGEGIQRARLRDGPAQEALLEPGKPALLRVRMGHAAALFRAGHRVGLHVTSSNFPRFSRNLNTAEPSNLAKEPRVAQQRVLHDQDHPSRLILWQVAGE